MTKEKLSLCDFFKTQNVVLACGVENTKEQGKNRAGLPICHNEVKVTAKTVKLVKPKKVCVK